MIFLTATSMRKFWLTWNGTFFARTIIARSQNWKNDVLSSVKKYLTPRQESYYNNIILKHVLYQLSNIFCFTRSWDSWYWMIILPPFRKRCDNYISDFKNERVAFIMRVKIWNKLEAFKIHTLIINKGLLETLNYYYLGIFVMRIRTSNTK